MMTVELEGIENDFCTENMSNEDHESLCLTKEYKRKCIFFDTGASQNVEQDRDMFIVYFELKVPIPMKQGEGVLYATGMGIVIYNFVRSDKSVYSEPGFALHTPKANAGMSIISKASFQDVGFGYMAPPFPSVQGYTGSTDYWFPRTWFPNLVPMKLEQADEGMRSIRMYSNNNSNLSLVPVYSETEIIEHDLKRYSFNTGELYDERAAVSALLEKLVGDGGRYSKYHPNVMLYLYENHYMMDTPESVLVSGEGLEESKADDCYVSGDVDPSTAAATAASTAAAGTAFAAAYQPEVEDAFDKEMLGVEAMLATS